MAMTRETIESPHHLRLLLVLGLTGLAGFLLGMVRFGEWQLSVESAQVLAGLVPYPGDSLTYYYQIKLWSLINQLSALCLRFGVSEIHLSMAISGIIGMLSLQSLAFLVWAVSRNPLLSILAPFTIFLYLTGGYDPSHPVRGFDSTVYPVYFMNTGQTYGALALPYVLIVFASFGSGLYGVGAFLLGMAPAVHAPSGAFCLAVFCLVYCLNARRLREQRSTLLIGFAIGAAVTLASLLAHVALTGGVAVPPLDRDLKKSFFLGFIRNVDVHRHPIRLVSWGMAAQVAGMLLLLLRTTLPQGEERIAKELLLQAIALASLISILVALVSHFPGMLPLEVLQAMPGRVQNVTLFALAPVLIGIMGAGRGRLPLLLLGGLLAAMLAAYLLNLTADASTLPVIWAVTAVIAAMLISGTAADAPPAPARAIRAVVGIIAAAGLLLTATLLKDPPAAWQATKHRFADWSNDGFMARVRFQGGMLLTGSNIYPVQLYTRRPVLLNGGFLNFFSYAPETAPQMDDILKKVYGVDVFSPDVMIIRSQGLNRTDGKALWESRTAGEWQELAREFRFTGILTYDDWKLDLPVEMHSPPCILYRVPAGTADGKESRQ